MRRNKGITSIVIGLLVLAVVGGEATAGGHTWRIKEIFSNADGTVQFIEVWESLGGAGEVATQGHSLVSGTNSVPVNGPVASPTSFRRLLFGTLDFQALPGAPAVDQTIVSNFFNQNGDTITYTGLDAQSFGPGVLPTDGLNSLNRDGTTGLNSPENYAQQVGSVDASPQPAGVPDGTAGTTPMTVVPLDASASSLSIAWDTSSCAGGDAHHIIYGQGLQLPDTTALPFAVAGSVCDIGSISPFVWNSSPVPGDSTRLVWWLLVEGSGATEGSWGTLSNGSERVGPGPAGSSGECGINARSLTNACGH